MSQFTLSPGFLGRALLTLSILGAAVLPAHATWSIVIIDRVTKEVAVGSATCLTDFDLQRWTPVLLVGVGGATAQSAVDSGGTNRRRIYDEFLNDTDPAQILRLLSANDSSHQSRQYGIVDTRGRALTFTGRSAGKWAGGVTGEIGDLVYAVQGNVLTGEPVVAEAEKALRETEGDLAEKLMAAMEAAAKMGGDGRCSCSPSDPDGCGSPPDDFEKSAHIAYMILARPGDTDGVCNLQKGCANGDYFMDFNISFQRELDVDPVKQIRAEYDDWRVAQEARPDGLRSTTQLSRSILPPDGTATANLLVTLRDWTGTQLDGADTLVVEHAADSAGITAIGAVQNSGDGTYLVPLTAGTQSGVDRLQITANDGGRPVRVFPAPTLTSRWATFEYPDGQPHRVLPTGGTRFRVQVTPVAEADTVAGVELIANDGTGEVTNPATRVSESIFDAEFPPTACGATVRYSLRATTAGGQLASDPLDAPQSQFSALAGVAVLDRLIDNFETDLGWTAERDGASAGDWQRGTPVNDVNYQYDPPFDSDFSGKCFLTDNRRGASDVDNGAVRLTSPIFDLTGGAPLVQFDYALRLSDQNGVDRLSVQANSSGGDGDWVELLFREKDAGKDAWVNERIDAATLRAAGVEPTSTMRLRLVVNDGNPQSTVEAGLDAFAARVVTCAPPFPRGDLNCDNSVDFADIDAFVLALTDEYGYRIGYPACYVGLGDINCDSSVDFDDIDGFVDCLVDGCPDCP